VWAYQSLTHCKLLIIASGFPPGEENTSRYYSMRQLAFLIDNMESVHCKYQYDINLTKNGKYAIENYVHVLTLKKNDIVPK
jgi:hypothetical protein